jgi:hypothetical protein
MLGVEELEDDLEVLQQLEPLVNAALNELIRHGEKIV